MKMILIACNSIRINEELKKINTLEIKYKNIFYKEGILETLEKNQNFNYIIIDLDLPGEIEINKLIEKILKINNNIKIIVTKKIKNKIKIKNKKIKIINYEKELNLNILLKNNLNLIGENIEKENKIIINKEKGEVISFFGNRKVGKTSLIFHIIHYLNNKENKILVIELNPEIPSFSRIFDLHKRNNFIKKSKKAIKNTYNRKKEKYTYKNRNFKIIKNQIISINKNIDYMYYKKIFKTNFINILKNNYKYILIENNLIKNKIINKEILKKSNKKILVINPNILEIENSKKILEKNNNNFEIIINKNSKYSISKYIIKSIFKNNKILGTINYKKEYEKIINSECKNKILKPQFFDKEILKIINKILSK